MADFMPTAGKASDPSPLESSVQRTNSMAYSYRPGDDALDGDRGSTIQQLEGAGLLRTASHGSKSGVSRSNTLKKQKSLSRKTSLKRSSSRKSLAAGSIKGVPVDDARSMGDEYNSAFYTPVPTSGNPTEILANRFQAWRKFLKDLIAYFREVQTSYEAKAKALLKVSNIANNTQAPTLFMTEGGLNDANVILRNFHRQAITEANKARDIEIDVVNQLSGLRADLGQKIKEIKSLSGDFKNSVDKEKDHTRKSINGLSEALAIAERDPDALSGKDDPYIIRLNVDRQIERQLDEENYLHRAYLNLEGSGRELESIVIGEIQKAYNALAGILKREADEAYGAIDQLRSGPITIPKDLEWSNFVAHDQHMISSDTPLRRVEDIVYPGKNHPIAAEVRAGMLERKSKYLKSYTPGWYVLSPTHLHEFKSADHIYSQAPVMSLLLADQKLGSHSQPGSSSHKFMLKGRQTGNMHRGHSWVFRAETYDTMLAWYDDIRALTEKTGEERNAFVRQHARSFSASSHRASSVSGDSALDEDEADEVPFSSQQSLKVEHHEKEADKPVRQRPQPGGRFPSDVQINRYLQAPLSPSSASSHSSELNTNAERHGQDISTMAGGLQPETKPAIQQAAAVGQGPSFAVSGAPTATAARTPAIYGTATQYGAEVSTPPTNVAQQTAATQPHSTSSQQESSFLGGREPSDLARHDSNYKSWMAPTVAGTAVGAAGVVAAEEYWRKQREEAEARHATEISAMPTGTTDTEKSVAGPPPTTATPPIAPLTATGGLPDPLSPNSERTVSDAATSVLSSSTAPIEMSETPNTGRVAFSDVQGEHTLYDTNPDGSVNAKPTGSFFPKVLRHNTDVSVSNLHVPGEYPKPA